MVRVDQCTIVVRFLVETEGDQTKIYVRKRRVRE